MRKNLCSLVLFFAFFSVASLAAAAPISLRLLWKQGQRFQIYWDTEQEIDQVAMGQKMRVLQNIGTGYLFETLAVTPKGEAQVKITFKKVVFKLQTAGQVVEYDSARPAKEVHPMAQGFAALLDQHFSMKIDAEGRVLSLQGVDAMFRSVMERIKGGSPEQRAQMATQLQQQFGDQALRQMMEQMMAIYPEKPVNIGDSWEKSLVMTGAVPMILKRKWTLVALRGKFAFLRLEAAISPNTQGKPLQMGPISMRYELSGKQTGTLFVEMESGFPMRGRSTQDLKGKIYLTAPNAQANAQQQQIWPIQIKTNVQFKPF